VSIPERRAHLARHSALERRLQVADLRGCVRTIR